jgi:hypothetical protein
MKTLQIEISDKAWKKLQNYYIVKQLLGAESQTISDLLLKKIVQGIEDEQESVSIKAKED